MQQDQAAQGSIKGACEDLQLPYVVNCKSSQEMWARLKKVHQENQSKINVHYYFEDLYTRKYAEGSSMADHIAAMLDIKYRIEQAGKTTPDLYVARAMILSLPKTQSWDIIKITLFELQSLTTEIVSTKLQQEANHHSCDTVTAKKNACPLINV